MATRIEEIIRRVTDLVSSQIGGGTPSGSRSVNSPGADSPLAAYIDQTLLKADATRDRVRELCQGATEYRFASVCVNSCWVPYCRELLGESGVSVCTVVGFPLGAMSSAGKAAETAAAVRDGADEIDMVVNVGWLLAGELKLVHEDIAAVVNAADGKLVKVIIETSYLTDEQKVTACVVAKLAGADFVKTSTGFSSSGATPDDVTLMRRTVGEEMGVKASGGIRDAETARAMISAGATRLGVSAGIEIVTGDRGAEAY